MLGEIIFSCWICIFKVLIVLALANGMPVLSRNILGSCCDWPIDCGKTLSDKHPLFGYSKTWRGILSAILVVCLIAPLLGFSMIDGALFALLAMSGDLISSFIKRRLGYIESSRFRGLDVLPESLLPVLVLYETLNITLVEGLLSVVLFYIFEMIISPILFRLHIRKRPY